MRPSHDELLDVWLYVYARSSLLEADRIVDALQVSRPDSATLRQALMCCIVVAYARPFTQSQVTKDSRVIPLKGINPPANLSSTHHMLLSLRDKVFGHKDAVPEEGHLTSPNIVRIRRVSSDFHLHATIVAEIAPELLADVKELCSFFAAHCVSQLAPFITKYRAEIMQRPEGFYDLVVSEPPEEWLCRHDPA